MAGRIGQYRVEELLGKGGVGAVYRAVDAFSLRQVALKVILPEHRNNPELRMRFVQEARIGAQLSHPHIVSVLGGGEIRRSRGVREDTEAAIEIPTLDGQELLDGTLYVAFELLEGPSLREHLLAHGPLPYWEVPSALGPLFEAVRYMHARGVVHRDLKPGNLHFGDTLKVLDLGSAKANHEALVTFEGLESTTGNNAPMTWEYRSPETFAGVPVVDPQVDLWALAGTVYRTVTGRVPFGGGSDLPSMVRRIMEGSFTPAREVDPSLPPAVDAFFSRAFALRVEDRFPSVEAMRDAAREAFAAPATRAAEVFPEAPPLAVSETPERSESLRPVELPTRVTGARLRWAVVALVAVTLMTFVVVRWWDARSEHLAETAARTATVGQQTAVRAPVSPPVAQHLVTAPAPASPAPAPERHVVPPLRVRQRPTIAAQPTAPRAPIVAPPLAPPSVSAAPPRAPRDLYAPY